MSTKRGPLLVATAAVFAYLTLIRLGAAPSEPEAQLQPQRAHVQTRRPRAPLTRPAQAQPKQLAAPAQPVLMTTTLQLTTAGRSAPQGNASIISLSQLETEHDFQALAAVMQQSSSPDAEEKQRAYEADFAAFPEAARGVSVKQLRCDEHHCIGEISARRQEDIDQFMQTAAQAARYPIYTVQQVVVEDSAQALRRFAISTDPSFAELPNVTP